MILVACVIGYVMGQWLKSRRKRADASEEAAEKIRRGLAYANRSTRKAKGKKRDKMTKSGRSSGK